MHSLIDHLREFNLVPDLCPHSESGVVRMRLAGYYDIEFGVNYRFVDYFYKVTGEHAGKEFLFKDIDHLEVRLRGKMLEVMEVEKYKIKGILEEKLNEFYK